MTKSAKNLRVGEKGIVLRLIGDQTLIRRLTDLGITEGAVITLKKAAPFGGPLELEVRGSRLGIRRDQAAGIVLRGDEEGGGQAASE